MPKAGVLKCVWCKPILEESNWKSCIQRLNLQLNSESLGLSHRWRWKWNITRKSDIWDRNSLQYINISVRDCSFVSALGAAFLHWVASEGKRPSLGVWRQWRCWHPVPQGIPAWRTFAGQAHSSIPGSFEAIIFCWQLLAQCQAHSLGGCEPWSSQVKAEAAWAGLGSPFPERSILCCHLALVQSINSRCPAGTLAEQGPEDAQWKPVTCATRAFQNCYLQPLQFCLSFPSLPLLFVFTFLGCENTNSDTKCGFTHNTAGAFIHGNFCLSMTY